MYKKSTHSIVLSSLLAVISLILSLVSVAVPGLAPFLKLDLSMIPIFFRLLLLGYKEAVVISLLKNFLHFFLISHEPIGSIANIIVEFIFLTAILKFYKKGNSQFILGGLLGTIAMTIIMSITNYFFLLPAYGYIVNLTDIVNNLKVLITASIIPFNLIKGIFLIALFFVTSKIATNLPNSIKYKFKK